jgi:predicted nucleic acid-binding protein
VSSGVQLQTDATPGAFSKPGTLTGVAEARGAFLLDTGFVVALLRADDSDHERCVEVWNELRAPRVISVEGILVESAHFLRRFRGGAAAVAGLVYGAATELVPTTHERAQRAVALMNKYHDVPMDFVDALLVTVAEERNVRDVLTLDRRGFETYRANGRERFRILP